MQKVSVYKCPECGMRYKSLAAWGDHMARIHPGVIPEGFSDARYYYYCLTGKTEGRCVQCHRPTEWNEATGKYQRYCNDPKCKQEYCKIAKQRMMDTYGRVHILNEPVQQRKMLASRSKPYKFKDGGIVYYLSSYEKDFLMVCEYTLGLKSKDIIGPSPHTYYYTYNDASHFYIPDFYIPDWNLEIEIKDGGDDPNEHWHMKEDRQKEAIKDQIMLKNKSVNYFKIVDKKYTDFYKFLTDLKEGIPDDVKMQIIDKLAIESSGINADYEAAVESAMFDRKDEYFNFDNWRKGKGTNILYVTGLSGSGKTTLGKNIAKKHNATLIELDRVIAGEPSIENWNPDGGTESDYVMQMLYQNKDDRWDNESTTAEIAIKRKIAIKKVYDYCMDNPNKLFVWEGIWLYEKFTNEYFIDKPLVIKGTSKLNSYKRGLIRDEVVLDEQGRQRFAAWYNNAELQLNRLRLYMRTNAERSYVKESVMTQGVTEAPRVIYKYDNFVDELMEFIDDMGFGAEFDDYVEEWEDAPRITIESARGDDFFTPVSLRKKNFLTNGNNTYYPIYVSLMEGITILGKIVRLYTKQQYSHSNISFDASMKDCYSVGTKVIRHNGRMMQLPGAAHESFIIDNKNRLVVYYPQDVKAKTFVMFFRIDQAEKVRDTINKIFLRHKNIKYSFKGLINFSFNKVSTMQDEYFCSQFVAMMLGSGKSDVLVRDPSLYAPCDLETLRGIFPVFEGKIGDYNEAEVRHKTIDKFNEIIKSGNISALEQTYFDE